MTPRAVLALGLGQCVNWGVLYYAFAVLLLPVEAELGVPRWTVAGAFSLALLLSAVAAPAVGRWSDRGLGPIVMQAGGFCAAGLLGLWALLPGVGLLYAVWAGLGVCMAAALYEPAFAVIGRAHASPAARLRALGVLTLCGGLASTVFLPLTAIFVRAWGWRWTAVSLAVVLAASTWTTRTVAFAGLRLEPGTARDEGAAALQASGGPGSPAFAFPLWVFAFVSLCGAAVIANIVPALGERGVAPTTAAMIGGLFGVMQLPGRALFMSGRLSPAPFRLLAICLGLQALGLVAIALMPHTVSLFGGIALFAGGAGLTTLVRPYLVHAVFGDGVAGYLNGRLAQAQQLARAGGPVLVASLAAAAGYGPVLALLGVVFALLAVAATRRRDAGR